MPATWYVAHLNHSLRAAAPAEADMELDLTPPAPETYRLPWEADELYFTVREPFTSRTSQANIVFGKVTPRAPLVLHSFMPEHGIIFSDGIESDYLAFNSGAVATIGIAERKAQLMVRG